MIPYVVAGAAITTLAALVGGYYVGRSDGRALEAAHQLSLEQLAEQTGRKTAIAAATAIAGIDIKQVTIRQEVQREVIEKPVYRECLHTPDGLRLVNAALTAQPGNPARDPVVPVPGPPQ